MMRGSVARCISICKSNAGRNGHGWSVVWIIGTR